MEDVEDFTYRVRVSDGPTFHFREICPKDFYFAQILRQSKKSQIDLVERLLLDKTVLDHCSSQQTRQVFTWAATTLLESSIFTVENWLELAYHLCKQRWDQSVDWLESQPMSKIQAMVEIVKKHADEQEKEMKKNRKRKK